MQIGVRGGLSRLLARAAVLLVLGSLAGCAWLDTRQRQLIYRPTPGQAADFAGLHPGDTRYFVELPPFATDPAPVAAQRVEFWWLPHADLQAPTLLYFHGTFRNLSQNLHKMDALRAAGFSVLAVEYRGWGLSTPITPSERSILQDAALAWAELERREPRSAQRVIYGHSMGSGVAVDLVSRLHAHDDVAALILESAFTSFDGLASEAGWIARLLAVFNRERFASIEKIGQVRVPLLMIHGSADTTVPMRLGQQLYDQANPPKQWQSIPGGGHSDLHQTGRVPYQEALRSFMQLHLSRPVDTPPPGATQATPGTSSRRD
jgi:pimeloyl-ACP methyl ester carboxylesterase